MPALKASGISPSLALKGGGRSISSQRQGSWAISLQVAMSICIVSAAFLLGSSLVHLVAGHSGFDLNGAATATIDLSSAQIDAEAGRRVFTRFGILS